MKILIGSMFCGLALFISANSSAASFDCSKARLNTEKQICDVGSLNDADVKLATTYQILLQTLPMGSRDNEKSDQLQWLKTRNQCGSSIVCIARSYAQRQNQLDDMLYQRVISQGPF